jgi:MoaA/NifB/PqqE/SkfB family radical SAM enzyme
MNIRTIGRLGRRHLATLLPEVIYLGTGIDTTRPTEIRASVTSRCNYRCLQCACWRFDEYHEMSIDRWKAGLASIKEFLGSYTIQFVGGEPFVKKGFLDLLEFCRDESIDAGVITNGSAFASDRIAERFVAARPLKLEISVDGATPEIHDRLRGIPGSLERISAGLLKLGEARRRHGARFPIRIKATLNAVNFRSMPDLVSWAVDRGATSIDFEPIREWTDESRGELWPTREDIGELEVVLGRLLGMQAAGLPIETSSGKLLGMIPHFLREPVPLEVATCRVGMRVFAISPVGIVESCEMFAPLGDLTRQSAREIWTGDAAAEVRRGTVACTRGCAYGCLATKSLAQKIRRGLMVFG